MKYVQPFAQISKDDISLVGGKGLSLGIMTQAGLPIPDGFIITTEAYKAFNDQGLPNEVQTDISRAFDALNINRVAVRSSAITEDSLTTSWAGQLGTSLNITRENLTESIKSCWDSIRYDKALAYAQRHGITQDKMLVAVVVQKMVDSDVSGVMFSANPITKNYDEIMIEAVYGLGELLVQGLVTPPNFVLDKKTLTIKSKTEGEQDKMLIFDEGKNKKVTLPDKLRQAEILNTEQLQELGKYAITIEQLYKKPQDIEWSREADKFYIVQSRPITTI